MVCTFICFMSYITQREQLYMYLSTLLQESNDVIISGLRSELSSPNQTLEEMTSYHQVTMEWFGRAVLCYTVLIYMYVHVLFNIHVLTPQN